MASDQQGYAQSKNTQKVPDEKKSDDVQKGIKQKFSPKEQHAGSYVLFGLSFVVALMMANSFNIVVFVVALILTGKPDIASTAASLYPLFLATFPLSTTTMIVVLVYKFDVVKDISQLLLIMGFSLIATSILSVILGIGGINEHDLPHASDIISYIAQLLALLFIRYGWFYFFISITMGWATAFVVCQYVLPRLNNNKES